MGNPETNKIVISSLLEQYGAAFKTLENIISLCPDDFWEDSKNGPAFYKIIYHIMFFLDMYLSSSKKESDSFIPRFEYAEDFRISKENFHPSEWTGIISKTETLEYIHDLKIKGHKRIENLTHQELIKESVFEWHGSSILSSLIYNLRHIMLHLGALQVRLRIQGIEERFWVSKSPVLE